MSKELKKILFLIPGVGFILLFLVIILGFMLAQSFGYFNYTGVSAFTLDNWKNVFNIRLMDSFKFSFSVGFVSSFVGLALAFILTFLIKNTYFEKTILSVIKVPIFIPALVGSFLIVNMFDYNGIVNYVLLKMNIIEEAIKFRGGDSMSLVYLVQLWKNTPFQLMLMYPAINGIRKDILEASRNLGASKFKTFLLMVIPLTISTSLISIIVVFIGTFGDFSVSTTAGPIYPFSLSRLMHYYAYNQNKWGISAAIGTLMIAVITVLVSLYTYIQRKFVK